MTHEDDPLDLDALYADRAPSAELERKIVDEWARVTTAAAPSGGRRRSERRRWAVRTAAAAALFAAGWIAARGTASPREPVGGAAGAGASAPTTPRYMLLLWEGPGFTPGPETGGYAREYAAWARGLASAGVGISGEELSTDVTWVAPLDRSAGPPREPGGLHVSGYFLVDVPDAATARRIAESHPHRAHGGWLEIVPVAVRPSSR